MKESGTLRMIHRNPEMRQVRGWETGRLINREYIIVGLHPVVRSTPGGLGLVGTTSTEVYLGLLGPIVGSSHERAASALMKGMLASLSERMRTLIVSRDGDTERPTGNCRAFLSATRLGVNFSKRNGRGIIPL